MASSTTSPPSVRRVDDVDPARWRNLLERCDDATFFHQQEWFTLYARHHRGDPVYLVAEADGELVGALAAVRFPRGPVHALESLPMGTYGGPLVREDAPTADALRDALFVAYNDLGRSPTCIRIQSVMRRAPAPSQYVTSPIHVIPLEGGFDGFWRNVYRKSRRNECSRAMRRGVVVDLEVTDADLEVFYELHLDAHARWGLRPHPLAFFDELRNVPGTEWFSVRVENRLLGCHVCFRSQDELLAWHGVTSRVDSKTYFPSSMLIRAEAELGSEWGLRRINLGGSSGLEGIESFKRYVGGEVDDTWVHEHNAWPTRVWRRLRGRSAAR